MNVWTWTCPIHGTYLRAIKVPGMPPGGEYGNPAVCAIQQDGKRCGQPLTLGERDDDEVTS